MIVTEIENSDKGGAIGKESNRDAYEHPKDDITCVMLLLRIELAMDRRQSSPLEARTCETCIDPAIDEAPKKGMRTTMKVENRVA